MTIFEDQLFAVQINFGQGLQLRFVVKDRRIGVHQQLAWLGVHLIREHKLNLYLDFSLLFSNHQQYIQQYSQIVEGCRQILNVRLLSMKYHSNIKRIDGLRNVIIEIRRMSHFIQNTREIQSVPILKTVSKQIVVPPIKSLKNGQSTLCENQNQQKMLKIVFFQLQNEEYEHEHQENSIEMQRKFQALKKKLARKSRLQTVQNILDEHVHLPKLQLSQIIKMSPERIDLMKKYRSKICGKLSLFRQCQSIQKGKSDYHDWYDATKNSPMKSPIFTKMTYLLQKVNKQSRQKEHQKEEKDKKILKNSGNSNRVLLQKQSLKEIKMHR